MTFPFARPSYFPLGRLSQPIYQIPSASFRLHPAPTASTPPPVIPISLPLLTRLPRPRSLCFLRLLSPFCFLSFHFACLSQRVLLSFNASPVTLTLLTASSLAGCFYLAFRCTLYPAHLDPSQPVPPSPSSPALLTASLSPSLLPSRLLPSLVPSFPPYVASIPLSTSTRPSLSRPSPPSPAPLSASRSLPAACCRLARQWKRPIPQSEWVMLWRRPAEPRDPMNIFLLC